MIPYSELGIRLRPNQLLQHPEGEARHLFILEPRHIAEIARRTDLSTEVTEQLILQGQNMLLTSVVTDGLNHYDNDKALKNISPLPQIPVAIRIPQGRFDALGVWFKREALLSPESFLDEHDYQYYSFTYRFMGKHTFTGGWFSSTKNPEETKLSFIFGEYPRTNRLVFYTVYKDEKPFAIFPFWDETLDQEVTIDGISDIFRHVYIRPSQNEYDRNALIGYAVNYAQEIRNCNRRLGYTVPRAFKHDLLFDTNIVLKSGIMVYPDRQNHFLSSFSVACMEDFDDVVYRMRIFRHEWLHIVDTLMGANGKDFSELCRLELCDLLNMHFDFKEMVQPHQENPRTFVFDNENMLCWGFSEHNVFSDSKTCGHAGQAVSEFLVSCMNAYMDIEFSSLYDKYTRAKDKDLKLFASINHYLRNPLSPAQLFLRRKALYKEIYTMVQERIGQLSGNI